MKLEGTFLRSKVARRVLLYFVLSAFIPFLVLAVLYFVQANRMLLKQGHTHLQAASATYATAIYERVLLANQLLRNVAGDLSGKSASGAPKEWLGRTFRGLTFVSPQGRAVSEFGDVLAVPIPDEAAMAHLRRGNAVLIDQEGPGQDRKILLIRAMNPLAADMRLAAAEIDPRYLWGDTETFPYQTSFCVLNEAFIALFCQQPIQPKAIGALIAQLPPYAKGKFSWQDGRQEFIGDYQEIFLQSNFLAMRWIVAASQPEAVALGPLATFGVIFWGNVLLSILVVTLLSLTQIRRTMVPLERLIEGTRRLGSNDFTTKVEVASADEFGELAGSFNAMATRLGRQFDTLTTLSKIDRAILSELDMDRIVEDVLLRLRENFEADCASISVVDHDSPEKVRTYAVGGNAARTPVERGTFTADTREMLLANTQGLWMSAEAMRRAIQVDLESASAQRFFTLPIIWKGQLVGVVCLGYPAPATLSDEDIAHIRDYADRIGVALSTAAREGQMYQQARTDALTGLPNRFFFMDRLKQDIVRAEREEGKLALLFIDLDRFKGINDSLGHSAGDELLRQAAARLRQGMREGDTVARLGGDEFTILINSLSSAKAAGTAAEHVIAALSRPFVIENVENVVTASIGIAVYPSDGDNAEQLMREADTAMYRAKAGGRGHYVFFEEAMNAEVVRRSTIERELRRAISERQFMLHYQPIVDPHAGRIRGVEALVRWRHPERGIVAPARFIGIAEETGLILAIGDIVLAEACAQFSAWRKQGVELEYVTVNVSARQFRQPNFVQTVEAVLLKHAVPPECLELEITESVLLDDTEAVMGMLARLKGFGVKIAIDDFGTGYSSLGYLERLPFDTLKIDISFVRKIREGDEGGAIAAMITAMAHSLGKRVVAEGVETQAQLDFLRNLDCELIQGFFYSRPLCAQELEALVNRGLPDWPVSPSAVAECADPYPAGGENADERVHGP